MQLAGVYICMSSLITITTSSNRETARIFSSFDPREITLNIKYNNKISCTLLLYVYLYIFQGCHFRLCVILLGLYPFLAFVYELSVYFRYFANDLLTLMKSYIFPLALSCICSKCNNTDNSRRFKRL